MLTTYIKSFRKRNQWQNELTDSDDIPEKMMFYGNILQPFQTFQDGRSDGQNNIFLGKCQNSNKLNPYSMVFNPLNATLIFMTHKYLLELFEFVCSAHSIVAPSLIILNSLDRKYWYALQYAMSINFRDHSKTLQSDGISNCTNLLFRSSSYARVQVLIALKNC